MYNAHVLVCTRLYIWGLAICHTRLNMLDSAQLCMGRGSGSLGGGIGEGEEEVVLLWTEMMSRVVGCVVVGGGGNTSMALVSNMELWRWCWAKTVW